MELEAAGELNYHRIAHSLTKSEGNLVELEHRQATILSRIAGLFGRLDVSVLSKCELITPQQYPSSSENAGRDELQSSLAYKTSGCSATAFPEGNNEDDERGLKGLNNNRNGMIHDCAREGGHRQCADGGGLEQGGGVEKRLTRILTEARAEFVFRRVPGDYYGRSFEERRDLLGAASVDHLCKSIVMVNTQAHESVVDCSDRNNSKYYVIVVQYTARLNAEKVRQFVYSLNNGKIPKKRFNLRLAPEEESNRLTGFEHNAVTPFGMRTNIPVILSDAIVKLNPAFFWLGGGEVDLKLGIRTEEFVKMINPFVVDCIY
ncbi:unnamed protein product [Calypogeia fissa]